LGLDGRKDRGGEVMKYKILFFNDYSLPIDDLEEAKTLCKKNKGGLVYTYENGTLGELVYEYPKKRQEAVK
jgi:hypothetical protein